MEPKHDEIAQAKSLIRNLSTGQKEEIYLMLAPERKISYPTLILVIATILLATWGAIEREHYHAKKVREEIAQKEQLLLQKEQSSHQAQAALREKARETLLLIMSGDLADATRQINECRKANQQNISNKKQQKRQG